MMKTRTPISTISYNTQPFLAYTFAELKASKRIVLADWIQHEPDNEVPDRVHTHIFCEPDGTIETNDLREALTEENPECLYMPLGCEPWRKSRFEDWYLYCCHNPGYLRKKGLDRERREYHLSDFQSTSLATLRLQISSEINYAKYGITETSSDSAKDIIADAACQRISLSTALMHPQVKMRLGAQDKTQIYLAAYRIDTVESLLAGYGITPNHPDYLRKKESLLIKMEGTGALISASMKTPSVRNAIEALNADRQYQNQLANEKIEREQEEFDEKYPF